MTMDLARLSSMMQNLYNNVLIQERILSLKDLRKEISNKEIIINRFCQDFKNYELGKSSKKLLKKLEHISVDFKSLYDNFDDKLMVFIIGNGNVGKSTLLNALIGYEVADTDFLPNTWKIDIYTPELTENKGIIKYDNGEEEILSIDRVKKIVTKEENKAKDSKGLYNKKLNENFKNLKTREERKEMKKYLADKYIYKSNISEVRWSVKRNWLLESCLLVDTPGLNQNLHDLEQMGNIHDYYHKADGVLWLLDGQTISAANTSHLFQELDEQLEVVNGIRDNIIAVINRMDLVKNNGGGEAVNKVYNDAKKVFGDKFKKIVPISAQQAFKGIRNNDSKLIAESGILQLQSVIRDIFISKSESIKNSAKIQGHNKLLDQALNSLNLFKEDIKQFENLYTEKQEKLQDSKEELIDSINDDIGRFFKSYLVDVEGRVNQYINRLGEGEGVSFIKSTIYNLDDFNLRRGKFIENKKLEIENSIHIWEKNSRISEYKHIVNKIELMKSDDLQDLNLDLSSLHNIKTYRPAVASGSSILDEIFVSVGNIFKKIGFFLRKDSIKNEINMAISNECQVMEKIMIESFNDIIKKGADHCDSIINITFESILFSYNDLNSIKNLIKNLEYDLSLAEEDVSFRDIIA